MWIDVEHYPVRPWSADRRANKAVVRRIVRADQDAGVSTGFYSTTLQWPAIVGTARWGLPEWHTAGQRSRAVALTRCSEVSFQGGPVVLAQWWTSSADHDVVCPSGPASAAMPSFFAASAATRHTFGGGPVVPVDGATPTGCWVSLIGDGARSLARRTISDHESA